MKWWTHKGLAVMQRVTGKTLLGYKLVSFTNLYSQGGIDSSVVIITGIKVMKMTEDHVIKRGHHVDAVDAHRPW